MKDEPRVSVVVPTYNRTGVLRDCLISLAAQTYENMQIVVSDDSTTDSVKSMLEDLDFRTRVDYHHNSRRLGLPANRNAGISKSSGDLVMFLDDDAVLEPACVSRLVQSYLELDANPYRVGAIGPAVMPEGEEIGNVGVLGNGRRLLCSSRGMPCREDRLTGVTIMDFSTNHKALVEVCNLHSCSMYPREVLSEIGGYEERAYQGNYICEETDLHTRIRRRGYRLFFEPRAIVHHRPASGGGCRVGFARYSYYYLRNQSIYIARYHGARGLYQIPILASSVLILTLMNVASNLKPTADSSECRTE